MGSGAATVVGTGVALVIAKHTNRTIAGIYTLVLACVGVIMMFTIPSHHYGTRYGGYILTLQCEPLNSQLATVLIVTSLQSLFASCSSSPI
jgi:ABC-type glucose/galactose transport system permease subunit